MRDSRPERQPDFEELRFSLHRRRRTHQWTLDDLAEHSGIGRRTLVQLEAGDSKGSLDTWFRLAETFDIDLGEMLAPLYGPTRRRD